MQLNFGLLGSSCRGSVVNESDGTMRLRVRSLASLSGLRIWHCCELWCRLQTWLWYRLAATALIGPLAWEPPYATGAALEKAKRQKKKKKPKIWSLRYKIFWGIPSDEGASHLHHTPFPLFSN